MEKLTIHKLFGGLPFISEEFNVTGFLTSVACARSKWNRVIGNSDFDLVEFLNPGLAIDIYFKLLSKIKPDLDQNLSAKDLSRIDDSISSIGRLMPNWRKYFQIEYKFYKIRDKRIIGFSSASKPQHIYLGDQSWVDNEELTEQVLHEIAHVWLYMVEELWAFHENNKVKLYTLPSGTSHKTATGVLNACFVACVLSKFYSNKGNIKRHEVLINYANSAISILNKSRELTFIGKEIRRTLQEFITEQFALLEVA
jgi:hypothetical protein